MKIAWLLLLALLTIPAYGDLPQGQWSTARAILLPKMAAPGLVYLPLDAETLAGVEETSGYRIVRAGREEVPYRVELENGATRSQELPAKIVSQGIAKDATGVSTRLEIVFDLGAEVGLANQVAFRLQGDNFRCRVLMDGARAADQPGLRVGEGLVYRHEGRFEQTKVAIAPNQFRFLRFTLQALQGKLPALERASLLSEVKVPPYLVPVPAELKRRENVTEHATILNLDFGMLVRNLALVRFQIEKPTFDRSGTIEVTDLHAVPVPPEERETGGEAFRAEVSTFGHSFALRRDAPAKPAVVPLAITSARKLAINILNGDDRPLTIKGVEVFRVRQGLILKADPAFEYELWYGWPGAPAPDYEIARLPLSTPPASLPLGELGRARRLAVKPPQVAWSEKHRALFWVILAAVLVLLAALIVRAMRNIKPTQQGGSP
jgi:hypothetical protein